MNNEYEDKIKAQKKKIDTLLLKIEKLNEESKTCSKDVLENELSMRLNIQKLVKSYIKEDAIVDHKF